MTTLEPAEVDVLFGREGDMATTQSAMTHPIRVRDYPPLKGFERSIWHLVGVRVTGGGDGGAARDREGNTGVVATEAIEDTHQDHGTGHDH